MGGGGDADSDKLGASCRRQGSRGSFDNRLGSSDPFDNHLGSCRCLGPGGQATGRRVVAIDGLEFEYRELCRRWFWDHNE
jgi:hypothetical protein